jgi:hypothetical protein
MRVCFPFGRSCLCQTDNLGASPVESQKAAGSTLMRDPWSWAGHHSRLPDSTTIETRDCDIDCCVMSFEQTHMHLVAGSCLCQTETCFPIRRMYFGDDKRVWEPR